MAGKKPRRGRPRKSSEATKSESVLLRLEAREKQAFTDAANAAGAPVSVWMRERLRSAAKSELQQAGLPVSFLPSIDQ
jgi:uncharacterized protein (DUF1778 family)